MPQAVDWERAYNIERSVADIIARQAISGWMFDTLGAHRHVKYLEDLQEELYKRVRPSLRLVLTIPYKDPVARPFKKNGEVNANVLKWYENGNEVVGGPFTRISWEEPNLGSDKQLKELLFWLGWVPTQWNYKKDKRGRKMYDKVTKEPITSSAKLTEDSYDSLTSPVGKDIAKYLKAKHRASQIRGFIKNVDCNDLIHAAAFPLGTPTGRMRHNIVVNVPKASEKVFFGTQMRGLFLHRPGRKLVGHDASGLEARLFGHFLNDEELIHELIHGDFHTKIWTPLIDFIDSRDNAKNFTYAIIYGAQDKKLGTMSQTRPNGWSDERTGAAMRAIMEKKIPAMGELMEKVRRASKRGYLVGLDGRKLFLRSAHSALNLAIQGAGAIVMKESIVLLDVWVNRYKLDVIKVGDFHDEAQADVLPAHVHAYGNLAVRSIIRAGQNLDLNCPLDADYKVGDSWAETH